MRANVMFGVIAILGMLGWSVQSSLADPKHGDSHGYSAGHGCCEEMMGHMGHYAHSADHLRHLLKHQKEIGLTEEQVKKLKAIDLDYDRARIKAEAERHIAERELHALVEEEKTDLSAIEAKVKQSEMLEVGLRMSAFKARQDALAVLTPEQREKAKAAHEKRMHEMMSGPHGCMPSGGR
jgi:Spy/CpxP family protein refolding chaperone